MSSTSKIVMWILLAVVLVVGGLALIITTGFREAYTPKLVWASPVFELGDKKHKFEINLSILSETGVVIRNAAASSRRKSVNRPEKGEYLLELNLDTSITSVVLSSSNSNLGRFRVRESNNKFVDGWKLWNPPGRLTELTLTTSGPIHLSSAVLEFYKLP